jgi:protease-4
VNSPGGEVFASEQIRREVVALQAAGKPVVVSMGDLAASGGYWISMNADRIYADASTISGSIGIFGLIPNFSRALGKIGVHTDGVGTTRIAGAFDPTKPLDPELGNVIQAVINKGYADFTGRVASARHKSVEQIDQIARGRVWSGQQAMERGLVDQLGGLKDAIADAAARAKLGEPGKYRVRYVEKELSPFEQFLANAAGSPMGSALLGRSEFAQAAMLKAMPQTAQQLKFVQAALERKPGVKPVTELAYCFCGF